MQSAGMMSYAGDQNAAEAPPPAVALVVAMAENRVIGRGGALPWQMPSDLKAFRRVTLGKPVIMGRKTFQSIGRPLDCRVNIVVTRGAEALAVGVVTAATMADAVEQGRRSARDTGAAEVMVIGGAEIYRQSLPWASRIYLTVVHATPDGDTLFPALNEGWREVRREPLPRTDRDEYAATLTVLERALSLDVP
jgi:dihydrofolate reductase